MADDVIDYDELFRLDPGAIFEFPPSTVRLSDDSINRLATAIADRLKD